MHDCPDIACMIVCVVVIIYLIDPRMAESTNSLSKSRSIYQLRNQNVSATEPSSAVSCIIDPSMRYNGKANCISCRDATIILM